MTNSDQIHPCCRILWHALNYFHVKMTTAYFKIAQDTRKARVHDVHGHLWTTLQLYGWCAVLNQHLKEA